MGIARIYCVFGIQPFCFSDFFFVLSCKFGTDAVRCAALTCRSAPPKLPYMQKRKTAEPITHLFVPPRRPRRNKTGKKESPWQRRSAKKNAPPCPGRRRKKYFSRKKKSRAKQRKAPTLCRGFSQLRGCLRRGYNAQSARVAAPCPSSTELFYRTNMNKV